MKKSELRKMAEEIFNHGLIICKYNFKQKEKKADASVIICIDDSLFGPCEYFQTKEEMIELLKDFDYSINPYSNKKANKEYHRKLSFK